MEVKFAKKEAFTVIGKLGSTADGNNFIERLWKEANMGFNEIAKSAKRDEEGKIIGVWGIMSSMDKSFKPWEENYSKGLYLAGLEVADNAVAPLNWIRMRVPEFNYAYVKVENNYSEVFRYVIGEFLPNNKLSLAGAVQEYYSPLENMQLYLFFPIS